METDIRSNHLLSIGRPFEEPLDLQAEYDSMLRRLCRLTCVPETDEPEVVATQALQLAGVAFAFRLEASSAFVKIYADVGEPEPARAHDAYRIMLEQQLLFPAPLAMAVGLQSESRHIVLYACAPLSIDSETDQDLLALLQSCVAVVKLLRADWTDLDE